MAWFVLARGLFVAAIAYSAYHIQPIAGLGPVPNVAFGLALAAVIVLLEARLRHTPVTHMLSALEGKEYNQGVAYLDDGTMVVVDNARKVIGQTIDVVVTSVLRTTAGKMIFGRFIEAGATGQIAPAPAVTAVEGRPRPQIPSSAAIAGK